MIHIIENSFNDNTTYLVGDWVNNGCQTFHIDDIQTVCDKFEVCQEEVDHVVNLHRTTGKVDLHQYIDHEDSRVISLLIKQGIVMPKFIESTDKRVQLTLVEESIGLEVLVNSQYMVVREAIANKGCFLDLLINDKAKQVRAAVLDKMGNMFAQEKSL